MLYVVRSARGPALASDLGGDERDTVLVAGSGRSGTTWVGGVIARLTRARTIFEPFLLDRALEFAPAQQMRLREKELMRERSLYVPADTGAESRHFASISAILQGKLNSIWCSRDCAPGIYRSRVIKDIRANLLLGYLARTWPQLRIVWVLRDPFAVIGSQLHMARRHGWAFDWNTAAALDQPDLMTDWLDGYRSALRHADTQGQRLAHRWCIETMVPFWQGVAAQPNVLVVRYEALAQGHAAWEGVARFVSGTPWPERDFQTAFESRSSTSPRTKSGALPDADADAIAQILDAYGVRETGILDDAIGCIAPRAARA